MGGAAGGLNLAPPVGPRHRVEVTSLFRIGPSEDRLRIRALRAMPPMRTATGTNRRRVFAAAPGQFAELLAAAASVGPVNGPMPLYYALNQAGRAIVAALQQPDRRWQPHIHWLRIEGPGDHRLQCTKISPQRTRDERPGSFQLLAEAIGAAVLPGRPCSRASGLRSQDSTGRGSEQVARARCHLRLTRGSSALVSAWLRHSTGYRRTRQRNPLASDSF